MTKSLLAGCIGLIVSMTMACTPKTNNGGSTMEGKQLTFETIAQEPYSGVNEANQLIITDGAAWRDLWAQIYSISDPKPELASVNFERETVAATFAGMKSNGGYSIEIQNIVDAGSAIHVFSKSIEPKKGQMNTMALTQPFHVVKFENPEGKKVLFK